MKAMQGRKSQSAIEYFNTYSWAILIMTGIFITLYLLGIFNLNFLTPTAPPGSCSVYRPQGPGTSYLVSLAGACTSEIPEYVAQFQNNNNWVDVGSFSAQIYKKPITLSLWAFVVYPTPISNWQDMAGLSNHVDTEFFITGAPAPTNHLDCGMAIGTGTPSATPVAAVLIDSTKWHHFVATYDGSTLRCYMDGVLKGTSSFSGYFTNTMVDFTIGFVDQPIGQYFQGSVSNVQFYNTSLSGTQVWALYKEGIGGIPFDLQHIIGWWPLNGDLKDYSGNGFNGNFFGNTNNIGLSYVSQWQRTYTAP